MKVTKSASRYAKAFLELSIEKDLVQDVAKDMNVFLKAYHETRDFQLFLDNPIIKAEKKNDVFKTLFPDFCNLSTLFVELIIRNHRESALAQIANSFVTQLKTHQGIVPVTIVSASKMGEDTKNTILGKLEKSIKGKIELDEQVDTSLIGGFIIKLGDTQIDASVSNKLKNLKVSLTR
jgi:F-type H+-transporting ATPase subunit delta